MNAIIDPLWDSPPKDAPELQRQAHRLMMKILMRMRSRVPEVLSAPQICDGARVMDAALAMSLNPKLDPVLRTAALTLLQRRIRTVDPRTPNRVFLPQPSQRCALAPTVGADLADLEGFEQAIEGHLLTERPGSVLRHRTAATPADALSRVGLLIALLVTRQGQTSTVLLGRVVQSLGQSPWVGGRWAWVDIRIPESAKGAVQIRRVYLDPSTLAAWLMAMDGAACLPKPKEGSKAGKVNEFYRRQARDGFKSLIGVMRASGQQTPIDSLNRLCHCQNQRLHVTAMPLIATYARGEVTSSSLELSTWLRLIGFQMPTTPTGGLEESAESAALVGQEAGAESDLAEQLAAGDLDEHGLLVDLRALMQLPRSDWPTAFDALICALKSSGVARQTDVLTVSWLRHLAVDRRNKGKRLADGSLLYYRGLLVNRLINYFPASLLAIDADELTEAYEEVIGSRRSPQQTSRIRAALADFDRYVRSHHVPDLPQVTLPGFDGGSYAISARIISPAEFVRGLRFIGDGSLVMASLTLASQVRAFWILAFRFGLRRSEILGLQARDLDDQWLRIRYNSARSLKTGNAYRLIPIHILDQEERKAVLAPRNEKHGDDCLFFETSCPTRRDFDAHPAIPRINDLLERVTGDSRLHPHNLRHAAPTLILMGCLGADLGLAGHPYAEPWMLDAQAFALKVDQAISGQLHRRAGRGAALGMLEGHGEETTTYEHYVHSLDLLLFFATNSGRFDPVKQKRDALRYPVRQETAQLLAMLGYSPTSRIETGNLPDLLKRIAAYRPEQTWQLEPVGKASVPIVEGAGLLAASITLQDLLDVEDAKEWRGWPETQAQRDTVVALLASLDMAYTGDPEQLRFLLQLWVDRQLKNDDWASMKGDEALKFIDGMAVLAPRITLDLLLVRSRKGRIKKVPPKSSLAFRIACLTGKGKFWIRLADPRPKRRTSRTKKGTRSLSISQCTVSWVVRAVCWGASSVDRSAH